MSIFIYFLAQYYTFGSSIPVKCEKHSKHSFKKMKLLQTQMKLPE